MNAPLGARDPNDPHAGGQLDGAGPPLDEAAGAMLMIHGRGASAESILTLADTIGDERFAYLAPAAAGHAWYPYGFMDQTERNEPWLSSALRLLDGIVGWIEEQGVPAERIVLLGFSQGGCLASEYAVRHARRYGGVIAYSGGLIGPVGTVWDYPGSFDGTPVLLGCSDVDPHIPLARVEESEEVFRRMGAEVTKRIYPGMGHMVNDEEVELTRRLLEGVAGKDGAAGT